MQGRAGVTVHGPVSSCKSYSIPVAKGHRQWPAIFEVSKVHGLLGQPGSLLDSCGRDN